MMLTFKTIQLKSADLGADSLIPDIQPKQNAPFFIPDESVDEKQKSKIGVGMINSILPYKMQNGYSRNFSNKEYRAAVLENEYLKAVFLPELGGRLWSLYDKKKNCDLVYENDCLCFANLALRNAWFAGGSEWNLGIKGHSMLTCEPLFTKKVIGKNGHEILKMYEYEEKRGLVYSINALLEQDKLVVRIEVENPYDKPTFMYWWSNIAAAQEEGTRIYVPAPQTYITSYREGGYRISKKALPIIDGKDVSDPLHADTAIDYFYDIPEDANKWIACLDKNGCGLLHSSSDRLIGRKTFLWGSRNGGMHWNRWLTDGRDYLEIQAGLAKTQFEHFEFAPHEKVAWQEIYTGVQLDDVSGTYAEVAARIDAFHENPDYMAEWFEETSSENLVVYGSGRGYLAERLNGKPLCDFCEFPQESVGDKETYYLDLLDGKAAVGTIETAFTADKRFVPYIEAKAEKTAFDWYTLGIIEYCNGEYDKALKTFEKSVADSREFYNLIALALYHTNLLDDNKKAFELAFEAAQLKPDYAPLVICMGELAIRAGEYSKFVDFCKDCNEEIKQTGRVKMYLGQCLVMMNDYKAAEKYINVDLVVADVREGEYAISNIWVMMYRKKMAIEGNIPEESITDEQVLEAYPIPYEIDFRMH